jgi:predicted RNA binding protein YcfA (HicA-like mRNA interferase family)
MSEIDATLRLQELGAHRVAPLQVMGHHRKLISKILSRQADSTVRFTDLCSLLRRLGFEERVRGSHHIFVRNGVAEILNLQPRSDRSAKPYQVRQVRDVLLRYGLGVAADD